MGSHTLFFTLLCISGGNTMVQSTWSSPGHHLRHSCWYLVMWLYPGWTIHKETTVPWQIWSGSTCSNISNHRHTITLSMARKMPCPQEKFWQLPATKFEWSHPRNWSSCFGSTGENAWIWPKEENNSSGSFVTSLFQWICISSSWLVNLLRRHNQHLKHLNELHVRHLHQLISNIRSKQQHVRKIKWIEILSPNISIW